MGFFDYIRKLFDRKVEEPFPDINICINCMAKISKSDRICKFCHHDQDKPVKKRQVDILTAVDSAISIGPTACKHFEEVAGNLTKDIKYKGKVYTELSLIYLSLNYVLFLDQYINHQKYKDIVLALQEGIDNLFLTLFDKTDYEFMITYFYSRVNQIQKAFSSQDPVNAISKMLQVIIAMRFGDEDETMREKLMSENLYMMAEMFAPPSIHQFTQCYIFISSVIIAAKILYNKWEIQ